MEREGGFEETQEELAGGDLDGRAGRLCDFFRTQNSTGKVLVAPKSVAGADSGGQRSLQTPIGCIMPPLSTATVSPGVHRTLR